MSVGDPQCIIWRSVASVIVESSLRRCLRGLVLPGHGVFTLFARGHDFRGESKGVIRQMGQHVLFSVGADSRYRRWKCTRPGSASGSSVVTSVGVPLPLSRRVPAAMRALSMLFSPNVLNKLRPNRAQKKSSPFFVAYCTETPLRLMLVLSLASLLVRKPRSTKGFSAMIGCRTSATVKRVWVRGDCS